MRSLQSIKLRIAATSLGFVVYLVLLLFRSYQLQIPENDKVDNLANRQHHAKLAGAPKRGSIYDRNGQILAMDVRVASIAVHPKQFKGTDQEIAKLAELSGIEPFKLREKLSSSKKFEWIARRIQAQKGAAIEEMDLKGVSVTPEYKRFYPNRELAGNVLGAVGYDAKALGGIELSLDSYLKTTQTTQFAERDAKGRLFTPFDVQEIYHDVHLTLDVNLQYVAEKYLWEQAEKYKPKSAFAIVMSPKTGEILAMANYPRFNPNAYWEYAPANWKNHAALDVFEPGSTFKPVIMAAGLESGKIKAGDIFFCENGTLQIGNRVIHDHDAYQNMDLADIIRVSSNIGVTKVARKTGKDVFHDMIKSLGFGEPVDINIPGMERGRVSSHKRWTDIDFSNISFGQGMSLNGVQLTAAYGVFANGGVRMKPLLVRKVIDSKGRIATENAPEQVAYVMSSKNAREVASMLMTVVHGEGTGRAARMAGYSVAGKTGTAQKVDPLTKRYDPHDHIGSFVGFVPARDPRFVISVTLDSPKPVHAGGVVAAPVFKSIASEILPYAGIPPDRPALAKVGVNPNEAVVSEALMD
jgi:cell division protein FtsI (penicillin-binding protein 3)